MTAAKNEISATSDKLVSKLQREIQYLKSLLTLRNKGGAEVIERELWSLREENEQLRQISTQLSLEEVQQLREENKRLKLQLQHVGKDLPHNSSFAVLESEDRGESQPSSSLEVMSTPDYRPNLAENPDQDTDIYEILTRQGTDIKSTLAQIRRKELRAAGLNLQRRAVAEGRCPICTLKVPCSHYQTRAELPERPAAGEERSVILNIAGLGEIQQGRETRESMSVRHSRFPGIPKAEDTHQRRALSYRYRGSSNTSAMPGRLIELKEARSRKKALKVAERKLSLLEKLEQFREAKLRAEVEKLEMEKQAEALQVQKDREREEKRQAYLQRQKEKLRLYESQRREKEAEDRKQAMLEESRRKRAELKAIKAREAKKRLIEEYKRKKRLIEGLESDQVQELGEC